jgi:hypothetical protein
VGGEGGCGRGLGFVGADGGVGCQDEDVEILCEGHLFSGEGLKLWPFRGEVINPLVNAPFYI